MLLGSLLVIGTLAYLLGQDSYGQIPVIVGMNLFGGLFTASLLSYFAYSEQLAANVRESERKYRELHSLQEAIFQSASGVAIIVGDTEGRITKFNRGAELMLGYDAEEIVGTKEPYPFHDYEEVGRRQAKLAAEYGTAVEGHDAFVMHAKHGKADDDEWTYIRKDGTRMTMRVAITPVVSEGVIVGFMGTGTDVTEIKRAQETLEQANRILTELSLMDGLTGIANRRHFDETLEKEWRRVERGGGPLSLILFDIDYFKRYNDTYGHQLGDDCLRKVSWALRSNVKRASDTAARYGGEEFAVILPDTDAAGAASLAEKLRSAIEADRIPHAGSQIGEHVTISVGVATIGSRQQAGQDALVAAADGALYEAKASGRNCVRARNAVPDTQVG